MEYKVLGNTVKGDNMKTVTEFIRQHIYELLNIYKPGMDEIIKANWEWLVKFVTLMLNRLIMGHFRYGSINNVNRPLRNYIQYIQIQLNRYSEDGNLERVVDIANTCMLEFKEGKHPKRHFKSIDDGEHIQ